MYVPFQTFTLGVLMLDRYQISSVADHFSTIGYLIPIMCILTVPVMPRARYLQNLVVTMVWTPLHLLPHRPN